MALLAPSASDLIFTRTFSPTIRSGLTRTCTDCVPREVVATQFFRLSEPFNFSLAKRKSKRTRLILLSLSVERTTRVRFPSLSFFAADLAFAVSSIVGIEPRFGCGSGPTGVHVRARLWTLRGPIVHQISDRADAATRSWN
jgi:hypothetical protein